MKIIEKTFNTNQLNTIKSLSKNCDITEITAKILYSRGYTSENSIKSFLNPGKHNFRSPFLLKGVSEAVERINLAKENGETVVVYGDYDADGICATTILNKSLKEFGIDAYTVIPERDNGYGLSKEVLDEVLENVFPDLIITVDCGISALQEVEYLKDLGVDVIITDHHEIPSEIPNTIVINCKFKNQDYLFDSLCGAGVAYKLSYALIGERANKYLDLVCLATIADSMPIIDENRDIVKEGLDIIKNGKSDKPLKFLMSICGIKDITASSLAYSVVPRINAGGRMGDAYSCLKLFNSNNISEIDDLSHKLVAYNVERQLECEKLYQEAKQLLKEMGTNKNSIVLWKDDWKNGLLGIVCAKLCEEYYMPVILFSKNGDSYHGSARSIESVNIYQSITNCEELLEGFGGHSQAAGLTIREENLEKFSSKLEEVISKNYDSSAFERVTYVDEIITDSIPKKFIREFSLLEPFGILNKKPIFATKVKKIKTNVIKDVHLSFNFNGLDYMYFNGVKDKDLLHLDLTKTVVFEPSVSTYNGKEYFKCYVKFIDDVVLQGSDVYNISLKRAFESLIHNNCQSQYVKLTFEETNNYINNVEPYGFKKLFVVNNPLNIAKFSNIKNLTKSVYNITEKGGKNCLLIGCISTLDRLDEYDTIIHLDKPIEVYNPFNAKVYINEDLNSFDLSGLKTDRNELVLIYKQIIKFVKERPLTLMEIYKIICKEVSIEQFLFASEVFKELGFIIEKDIIYLDAKAKSELTNSKIYNIITKNYGGK